VFTITHSCSTGNISCKFLKLILRQNPLLFSTSLLPLLTIPPSIYFVRSYLQKRRLQKHGIGKGAPGFQTGVRQIRVTPEIAARLRRGEQVSPEEIAAASEAAAAAAQSAPRRMPVVERQLGETDERGQAGGTSGVQAENDGSGGEDEEEEGEQAGGVKHRRRKAKAKGRRRK
jgi:hypothetical protein